MEYLIENYGPIYVDYYVLIGIIQALVFLRVNRNTFNEIIVGPGSTLFVTVILMVFAPMVSALLIWQLVSNVCFFLIGGDLNKKAMLKEMKKYEEEKLEEERKKLIQEEEKKKIQEEVNFTKS